jgi:hypothetical protein
MHYILNMLHKIYNIILAIDLEHHLKDISLMRS